MGGFGKVVYLKGMNMVILMHPQGIAVQYPLHIFRIVHMMMHIDIAIMNRKRLFHFRLNRAAKLFRFLGGWKRVEEMPKVLKYGFNPLRPPAPQIENQPGTLRHPENISF
jgi:hypothetical protein